MEASRTLLLGQSAKTGEWGMKPKMILALLMTATLGGCNTSEPAATAAALATDVPQDYRQAALAAVRKSLKDPDSAKDIEISTPKTGFVPYRSFSGSVVCVRLNAKNSFGGYTGTAPFSVAFSNGKVIDVYENNYNACGKADYSPFSEVKKL